MMGVKSMNEIVLIAIITAGSGFFGAKNSNWIELIDLANKASIELYSRIKDTYVKEWINKMCFKAYSAKPKNIDDLIKIDAFFNKGIQHFISWHLGELSTKELKPFCLDKL